MGTPNGVAPPPPLFLCAMPPPEPTVGTTRRACKEGDYVALVHSSRGGCPIWGEEPLRRGVLGGGDTRRSSLGGHTLGLSVPLLLPPLPTPCRLGPDLGRRWCPRWLSTADLCPGRSLGHVGSSAAPSTDGTLASSSVSHGLTKEVDECNLQIYMVPNPPNTSA
jgi:hypothetical protein